MRIENDIIIDKFVLDLDNSIAVYNNMSIHFLFIIKLNYQLEVKKNILFLLIKINLSHRLKIKWINFKHF